MKNQVKRVAAIHDLSGFGRASLTVIIPILSSMGIQVCPMPTAVLSSHTGGFKDFTFVDLTDTMRDYMNHWKKIDMDFDCIYSGFMGSGEQVDIISDFIDYFKKDDTMVVVDPVMGDNGELYATIDEYLVEKMKHLVTKADIITPNLTEANYLLGRDMKKTIREDEVKDILVKLSEFGPETVVMTGVVVEGEEKYINVYAYEKDINKFWNARTERIPASYPGTGDAYTSALIGGILKGDSLPIAIERSMQFISIAIRESFGFAYESRNGVLIEKVLDTLKMPITFSQFREL